MAGPLQLGKSCNPQLACQVPEHVLLLFLLMQLSVIITSFGCRNTGTNTAPARQKLGAATEHRLKSAENLRMPKVPCIVNVCICTLAQHNTMLYISFSEGL